MRSTSGFTLLELLVVIALMALLAVAVPFVNHGLLDQVRLAFAVRSVTARIYRAEASAQTRNVPVGLTSEALQEAATAMVQLEVGDQTQSSKVLWVFPDGSATHARVILRAGRLTRTLTIDDLIGRVVAEL